MGFIAEMSKAAILGQNQGSDLWRRTFGQAKETPSKPIQQSDRGGSWVKSSTSSIESTKRLIQALRSQAPGGWTDDRYTESQKYIDIAYVAIHRQNELLTQAEFQLYVKDPNHPDGKRPITPEDPPHGDRLVKPYDLVRLLECPNEDDSFGDLIAQFNLQMDLTGTSLSWMVPNELGYPMELYPIPTATMIPQPVMSPEYPKGFYRVQPLYPYGPFSSYPTPASSVGAPIPAEWVLKFKYPHPLLRYEGYSPLTAMRFQMDTLEMMNKSRWYSMKRSINPSAVMNFDEAEGMMPLPESEIQRIHAEWEANFQGVENHGKFIVGSPGGKIEEWGRSPRDMDYPAGWEQTTGFILGGGFGITKPAAGMVEDSSYSTLFATLKQLYWLTLDPKCARFANKMTRHLCPFFGDNLILEIRCKRIDDHEIFKGAIDTAMSAKAITKNEVRKRLEVLNLEPTKEKWGDEIAGKEEQQQGMPGMPGMPGQGQPMPGQEQNGRPIPPDLSGLEDNEEMVRPEPPEISSSRPDTGTLNEGSLGPRKSIKSILRQRGKVLVNGNGKHILNGKHKKSLYAEIRDKLKT